MVRIQAHTMFSATPHFTAEALAKTLAPCFSEALAVDYEHDACDEAVAAA